jgi:hypothetical protein
MGRTLTTLALLLGLTCTGCASEGLVRMGGRVSLATGGEQSASFSIARSTFVAALERGPSWLIQNVTVRPVLLDRMFYGFQLVSLFPEDANRQRLPIQAGDIVQQVNGLPIERPDQFMEVWQSLSTADHLSIRVIRDGRPLMITWLIQPDPPGERTVSYGEPNAR